MLRARNQAFRHDVRNAVFRRIRFTQNCDELFIIEISRFAFVKRAASVAIDELKILVIGEKDVNGIFSRENRRTVGERDGRGEELIAFHGSKYARESFACHEKSFGNRIFFRFPFNCATLTATGRDMLSAPLSPPAQF